MRRLEILYAEKTNREEPHEWIRRLGGREPDGRAWRIDADEAIRCLEAGDKSLFVRCDGRELDVVIDRDPTGHKLLRIAGNELGPNALLDLPECSL